MAKSFAVELRELQYDLATDLQTGEAGLDEVEQIIAAITQLHQAYSNQRVKEARIGEVEKILAWYGETSKDRVYTFLSEYLAELKRLA